MNSLERSLQIGLVVSVLVLMLLFWWAGSLASRLLSENLVYQRLEGDASTLLAALEFPELELDAPRLGVVQLNPAYEVPYAGKYYMIKLETGGTILSRSMWEQGIETDEIAPGEKAKLRRFGIAGEELLVWAGGFSKNGHLFTIVVAEDITPIVERQTVFKLYFAAIALLLLIALLLVQHLIVRYSLNKLDVVRADINALELGQAVALSEDVPSEVLPLVQEFNRLLALFEQRLKQSRNAMGNLAHSLKGPLNLLLRASNEHNPESPAEQKLQVKQNAELIRQLIERELKRARLAGRSSVGQIFNLRDELPALTGLLKQIYSDKKVAVQSHIGPDVELLFDREDMLELIGNLLDNAVKWAASRVSLSVVMQDGVHISIEDDGPGCSPEQLHLLTQRGVRLDENVAGHGLGLSIVKDIVETYGGTVTFGDSEDLGGLRASVFLPSREASQVDG